MIAKGDAKSHCRCRAIPPYPLDDGRLRERRFNARRGLTPATLAETKKILATRDRNLNPVQTAADLAIIYSSDVGGGDPTKNNGGRLGHSNANGKGAEYLNDYVHRLFEWQFECPFGCPFGYLMKLQFKWPF